MRSANIISFSTICFTSLMIKLIFTIKSRIIFLMEVSRNALAGLGFFLAYQSNLVPQERLDYVLLFVVTPIAGLSGIESIFLSDKSARAKSREIGSAYQTQSGFNNLSIAITALIVWYFQWGRAASLTVILITLIFFSLSSLNHTYEYFIEKNNKRIHLMRPILTMILVLACIPLMRWSCPNITDTLL